MNIYGLRLLEELLREKQTERMNAEKEFIKDYEMQFSLKYFLPLSETDFRTMKVSVEMVKLLIKKEANSIDTSISRKEIVKTIKPKRKDIQRIFDTSRKFSPVKLNIFGFDSEARKTNFFIKDPKKAKQWLKIMERLV